MSGRAATMAGLLAGFISAGIFLAGLFEPLETKAYDYWLRRLPASQLEPELSLLEVPTSASAGSLARIVRGLDSAGAEIIVLHGPLPGDPGLDELALAIQGHGGVIVAAPFAAEDLDRLRRGESPLRDPPSGELGASAVAVAFTDRYPGPDGVLRRFTPHAGDVPEVGYATAAATRTDIELPTQAPMLGDPRAFGPGPRLLIPFRHTNVRRVDLASLEGGAADLKRKTLIVGSNTPTWKTPIGTMTDPEVTLQIASGILGANGITRAPSWMVVIAVIVVAVSLSIGAGRPQPMIDVFVPVAVGVMVWFLAGIALRNGTWVDVVPIIAAMGTQLAATSVLRGLVKRDPLAPMLKVLTRLLMHGCIAETAALMIVEEGRHVAQESVGDVPMHLVAVIPREGIKEERRDEGNVVGISLRPWIDGGVVVVRPHSNVLTDKRIQMLREVVAFAESSQTDAVGRERILLFLRRVASLMDENDHFYQGHDQRIGNLAVAIGRKAGLSEPQLRALNEAAFLHDIGRIGLPDRIIDSTSRLTDDEYRRVKRHAELSASILKEAGMSRELVEAVRDHHERWDGKGYPNRLSGEDIPIESRVLAVADAVMSLISDRPYRRGTSLTAALNEIASERGRMFDPLLVEAVIEVAIEQPEIFGDAKVTA